MIDTKRLGHPTFKIKLAGRIVFLDPSLDGNPKAPIRTSDVKEAYVVCVTHDHTDRIGSAFEICKRTGATFAGTPELCNYAKEME